MHGSGVRVNADEHARVWTVQPGAVQLPETVTVEPDLSNAAQFETTQGLVVGSHFPFALQYIVRTWVSSLSFPSPGPAATGPMVAFMVWNVPTTLLLSGFCDQWRELIIGTNLGGLGNRPGRAA